MLNSVSPQAAMVDSSLPLYGSASMGVSSLKALTGALHEDTSSQDHDEGSRSDSSLELSPLPTLWVHCPAGLMSLTQTLRTLTAGSLKHSNRQSSYLNSVSTDA